MRKIVSYILVLFIFFVSCTKGENDVSEVLRPWKRYVMFSTQVQTKAEALTSLQEKNFRVIGYTYAKATTWTAAKAQATPEPNWYNQVVSCNSTGICTYNGGNPLEWNLSNKYAFFALYPTAGTLGVELTTTQTSSGTPSITYTSPVHASTSVDPSDMVDLMTAAALDLSGENSTYVNLNFKHRLFCLEVVAQNYNSTPETVKNVQLKINNLKWGKMTLSLDADDKTEPVTTQRNNQSSAVTFNLLSGNQSVTVDKFENIKGKAVSISGVNREKVLMLIPQDCSSTSLTGNISLTRADGTTISKDFTSSTNFMAGVKYNLVVSFTGESITIAIIEADQWDYLPIDIEFE